MDYTMVFPKDRILCVYICYTSKTCILSYSTLKTCVFIEYKILLYSVVKGY